MSLMIIFLILSFVGFFLIALFMLPRSSAQSVLLDEVTRQARKAQNSAAAQTALSRVDVDLLARPFPLFRGFFSSEPDPDLVGRLMFAGYRKPAHVDIFLG